MTANQISIVAETISYFFVTTDLYGQTRLKNLHQRIIGIKDLAKDAYSKNVWKIYIVLTMLSLIGLLIYMVFRYKEEDIHEVQMGYRIVSFIFMGIFFVFFFPIPMMIIVLIFGGLFFIIALGLLRTILNLIPLEGFLLVIGTILFLTSKVVSFFIS